MRCLGHFSLAPADVRGAILHRDAVLRVGSSQCWAMSTAISLPRLWSYATSAVLKGLTQSIEGSSALKGAARVQQAHQDAKSALVDACNALIEKSLPDATLVLVLVDPSGCHVLNVGGGRVYIHRRGKPQRLTEKDAPGEGLIHGEATIAQYDIRPGDLILAGSSTAFSTQSVSRVATVLDSDPNTPPSVLASLLTEPARKAGAGGSALALRVK